MTKTLILFRHGKSDRSFFNLNDFDRPLNERGKQQTPLMAKELLKLNIVPDKMYISASKRTRQTAKLICKTTDWDNASLHDELYLASTDELIHFIQNIPDKVSIAMIVGHNPALTEIVSQISHSHIDNLPTAGYLVFSLMDWKECGLNQDHCNLTHFNYPKNIQK
jgi:phosphohistidine phosphatase